MKPQLLRMALSMMFVVATGRTQPPVQLTNLWNFPCSYEWAGISGSTGCDVEGECNPQLINGPAFAEGSWWESWSCNSGYVDANGQASITYIFEFDPDNSNSYSYPAGLIVNGSATVTTEVYGGWGVTTSYSGYYGTDCLGNLQYSGAYDYIC